MKIYTRNCEATGAKFWKMYTLQRDGVDERLPVEKKGMWKVPKGGNSMWFQRIRQSMLSRPPAS